MGAMGKVLLRVGLAAALAGVLPGCGLTLRRPPYPEDPLLVSKRPLRSLPAQAEPALLVQTEPAVLPIPPSALVSLQQMPHSLLAEASATPPERSIPARPAVRSNRHTPDATTTSRRPPTGPAEALQGGVPLGHAPDYSWIQGVLLLERGRLHLHFGEAGSLDGWGGRMDVQDDPRLRRYREGDLIRIEGEILHDRMAAEGVPGGLPVPYRIR
jgi:hypothetical protein